MIPVPNEFSSCSMTNPRFKNVIESKRIFSDVDYRGMGLNIRKFYGAKLKRISDTNWTPLLKCHTLKLDECRMDLGFSFYTYECMIPVCEKNLDENIKGSSLKIKHVIELYN